MTVKELEFDTQHFIEAHTALVYYNGTRTHLSLSKDAPILAPLRQSDALSAVQS